MGVGPLEGQTGKSTEAWERRRCRGPAREAFVKLSSTGTTDVESFEDFPWADASPRLRETAGALCPLRARQWMPPELPVREAPWQYGEGSLES